VLHTFRLQCKRDTYKHEGASSAHHKVQLLLTLLRLLLLLPPTILLLPLLMLLLSQAAPEPKPLPLHVQVAAREVMTGVVSCSTAIAWWPFDQNRYGG
jgi:hypothetical protein